MNKPPAISDAEWKIMRTLWRRSPQTTAEIVQNLAQDSDWHPNTIKTLLSRLVVKRALRVKKHKNTQLYRPVVSEESCLHSQSESFLDRFFGGAVQPLLVHFAKQKRLTVADLEHLRQILETKEP